MDNNHNKHIFDRSTYHKPAHQKKNVYTDKNPNDGCDIYKCLGAAFVGGLCMVFELKRG